MRLNNHIAYSFLTDDNRALEILTHTYGKIDLDKPVPPDVAGFWQTINKENQKAYYCTESMLSKLDMLKVERKDDTFDWSVFKHLSDRKVTFIFPDNSLLRMTMSENTLAFVHLKMDIKDKTNLTDTMKWVMFYVNRYTGEQCDYFSHIDVKTIEKFIYRLLCFMYLTENDEVIVPSGGKNGTKKSGKIINILPVPLTIVTSRWNTTVIRTEKFGVRGHFRLQPYGTAMSLTKIIFIEPFEKNGYTRKAKSKNEK